MMDASQSAREFDPSSDLVFPLKAMTFDGKQYAPGVGGPLPTSGNAERIRQLIRLHLAEVRARKAAQPPAPKAPVVKGDHECAVCGRSFASKLNLGAHARSHKAPSKKR